jgi:hypothetical protein
MDLDYHLLESKELDKEEKKEKKDHSSAYYRFINQFKNHLKKIENNFSGDDIHQLTNHFNFINKCENDVEEQRENCLNCYKALKEQISLIEQYIPNFDINIFNTFFQTFEEYYSFFMKTKEILKTFSKYNDETQNLYYICQRRNFCIDAVKEYIDKISEEYADKIEQYEILNNKFKELTESYEKLYKIYNENKNSELNNLENVDNEKLMISKLNQKIRDLTLENDRINKKYLECSRELERINMHLKFNYILKSESDNKINEYKFKMEHFVSESIRIKDELKSLKKENEKLIEQKEYFENKINSELNNINCYDSNNNNTTKEENTSENINLLIEENKNEEEEESGSGKDLQNLLMNCEEYESEEVEQKEEKLEENEKININNINNNIDEEKKISISININNEKENKPEIIENKENEDINNKDNNDNINKYKKTKTVRFLEKEPKMKKSIKLNKLKSKKSDEINSAYNLMFKGRHFQYPTRIAVKDNRDYFKQFFFLLFQSMKLNSDNIGNFLGYSPENLYNECRKEHIPFHKYQKWIEKKLLKKERLENEKKYEDFKTITGIFCSSLI